MHGMENVTFKSLAPLCKFWGLDLWVFHL